MRLLRAGVPLSLLIDLVDPEGPDSSAISLVEGAPSSCLDSVTWAGSTSFGRGATG